MARLNQLDNQLRNHDGFLNGLVSAIVELVNTRQKEVNREFVPVVAAAMEHAYQVATDERGQGSYARMKSYVTNHVLQNQQRMFRDACEQVRDQLNKMCDEVQRQLAEQTTQIYQTAYRDYNSAVGNLGAAEVELSPAEKKLRADVEAIVKTAEEVFERVLEGEEDPDEMAAQAEDADAEEDEGADAVKDEGAGENEPDDEHSTVKQENANTNEAQAAEQHPLGRTLAEELLAAQNENKENAVDADTTTAGKPTWKPAQR
ncbi:uncharacterized protein J3D65DRAFT_125009 [Phyllosticta citribraziliensis]|uniref:Uncharacterized protein n=1 Tax=Phyllosticta citribraziliensis TaxID=989973 RepID=A0ABR1L914_9PEZI